MNDRTGTQVGILRIGTILKDNNNGTVLVGLDEGGLHQTPQKFIVPYPLDWSGNEGEFAGGGVKKGRTVLLSQGQGGQWFILKYLPSNNVFGDNNYLGHSSYENNLMASLKPNRYLIQVKNDHKIIVDPDLGIQLGNSVNFLQINPKYNIISHNFNTNLSFTEASRKIQGVVKRDIYDTFNNQTLGATLDSQNYDKSLYTIGLDPTIATTITTVGNNIRNPPLVEERKIYYEFAHSFNFTNDNDESSRYADPKSKNNIRATKINRREIRADALSLSLEYPNHLIESIIGTVVDSFGNIVDINRNPLPIGKIDQVSLNKNPDKAEAFRKIRALSRKSIAFHWQLNTKNGDSLDSLTLPPNIENTSNYSRTESQFIIDIDKEGQFKIMAPASSEVGNMPLLTRYQNYSNLLANQDSSISPNAFIRSSNNQDVFAKNFAGKANIKLSGSDANLDGYEAPIDFLTEKPIQYGTAFHNINTTCNEFQTTANYLKSGLKLINFNPLHHLNTDFKPLSKIVSDNIIVSGNKANAGGRSGSITLDGFLMLNIGANTIDRQSLWFDYAGGVIGNYGRDKQGISYAGSYDGDIFMQIGGPGIGNNYDTRFANENDSYRNGTLDIRVHCNGQLSILRIGPTGIDIITPGKMTFSCQQDMIFRSNSSMKFEAEMIVMHSETTKRIINKFPANSIG